MLDVAVSSMLEDRSTGDSSPDLEARGAIRADERPLRCPEIDDRLRGRVSGAVGFAPARWCSSPASMSIDDRSSCPGVELPRWIVLDVDRSTLPIAIAPDRSRVLAPVSFVGATIQGRNYWGGCGKLVKPSPVFHRLWITCGSRKIGWAG